LQEQNSIDAPAEETLSLAQQIPSSPESSREKPGSIGSMASLLEIEVFSGINYRTRCKDSVVFQDLNRPAGFERHSILKCLQLFGV